jgi:hypothetical protein
VGGKNKESNKASKRTMSENPKSHLHIPQFLKIIYLLNIIIQNTLEKRGCKGKGFLKNTQNPNAPNRGTSI